MASLEAFRTRKLQLLESIIARPRMFATSTQDAYAWMLPLVQDLQELYDRPDEHGAWEWVAHAPRKRWDEYGVPGLSRWFEGPERRCVSAVISCYVEVAAKLGLLELERRYSAEAWVQAGFADGERFRSLRVPAAEVRELVGPPSLVVGNDDVLCYAHEDDAHGWVFLDFDVWDGPDRVRLLRNARLPRTPARAGLILTG